MNDPRPIDRCRVCRNANLSEVVSFGDFALTGHFPHPGEELPRWPIRLMSCNACGLLQLGHAFDSSALYGPHYGYRSGLNGSMVRHLRRIAEDGTDLAGLEPGDLVLDIGSNDGTLLGFIPAHCERIGIDPSASRWADRYPAGAKLLPEFFSAAAVRRVTDKRAQLVTSIAMFYDLDDPVAFAREVADILAPDGLWIIEVAYAGIMLELGIYDGICHEHTEYYSYSTINRIMEEAGLDIVDAKISAANGGSLQVIAGHNWNPERQANIVGDALRWREEWAHGTAELGGFRDAVEAHPAMLVDALEPYRRVACYGASTKGNVLLQHCGLGADRIIACAEVNEEKYGRVTPGTGIPILPADEVAAMNPDAYLVLPWHFRRGIIAREREYLASGGKLIFPLPGAPEVVGA